MLKSRKKMKMIKTTAQIRSLMISSTAWRNPNCQNAS